MSVEIVTIETAAEVAGITYPYKNWSELICKHKPSVKVGTSHLKRGTMRLTEHHIGRPRKRLGISPKMPRIMPKVGKLR